MPDIRVRSRVEDERITLGPEERAGNGGNLADEVWVNVVCEEPSSHDVKLIADCQDRVGHAFLLDLSAAYWQGCKDSQPSTGADLEPPQEAAGRSRRASFTEVPPPQSRSAGAAHTERALLEDVGVAHRGAELTMAAEFLHGAPHSEAKTQCEAETHDRERHRGLRPRTDGRDLAVDGRGAHRCWAAWLDA
jgi:hypothetical protein